MKLDPVFKERRAQFQEAVDALLSRLRPQSLGPCHYCGYPITDCYFGPPENMVPTCPICEHLLDDLKLHRIFEDEEPAMAI